MGARSSKRHSASQPHFFVPLSILPMIPLLYSAITRFEIRPRNSMSLRRNSTSTHLHALQRRHQPRVLSRLLLILLPLLRRQLVQLLLHPVVDLLNLQYLSHNIPHVAVSVGQRSRCPGPQFLSGGCYLWGSIETCFGPQGCSYPPESLRNRGAGRVYVSDPRVERSEGELPAARDRHTYLPHPTDKHRRLYISSVPVSRVAQQTQTRFASPPRPHIPGEGEGRTMRGWAVSSIKTATHVRIAAPDLLSS